MNRNALALAFIVLALSALTVMVAYNISGNDIHSLKYTHTPVPTQTPTPTVVPTATPVPTQTPTPTVVPTATPVPTPTPTPTVVPTATPVPTQTPTPTVVPTATPVPTQTPTPTVVPTATPVPTPTPTPTVVPTATPVPTPTPTPTVVPTATPVPTPTPTSIVFSDGFESGWNAWNYNTPYRSSELPSIGSGPYGSQGATWALESSIVHSGSYAAEFTLPATVDSWANVYKTIEYEPTLYLSDWFMFNASIPNGSYLLIGPCICGYHDYDLACGYIYNSNGTLQWSLGYYTNDACDTELFVSSDLGPNIQTNVWYNVQVMVTVADGNGEAAMWVMQQGQSQFSEIGHVTGLTNDGDTGPNGEIGACNLQVGPFLPDTSWTPSQQAFPVTAWYDDVIASTTYINPV